MADTASRLLLLLSLLQAQRRRSASALAARLGVTTRTVRADVERLRSLGYGIDATPGPTDGYRMRAGASLPPLLLDDEEAIAVAVGLRTAAASGVAGIGEQAARAVVKLEQLLPSRLRHRLSTVNAVAETAPSQRDLVDGEVLAAVATACHRNEQLRLDYCDRQQESTRRQVEPHRLIHVGGRWYLVAYDLDRADWRSFRLDRISPKTPTGPRFVPRELPGPDLATFVTRGRMQALWNCRARVIVHAPAETVAGRIPTGIWTVQPLDAHASQLDAGAHTAELLAAHLGALGLDFSIDAEQAPELAEAAATLARRYAASTSGPA